MIRFIRFEEASVVVFPLFPAKSGAFYRLSCRALLFLPSNCGPLLFLVADFGAGFCNSQVWIPGKCFWQWLGGCDGHKPGQGLILEL